MSYAAYANVIHLLSDARFVQREKADDRTLVYRFDGPRRKRSGLAGRPWEQRG